jgi:hypothetical protein
MSDSMTNHLRNAVLTFALFGGIGVALAQSSSQGSGNVESTQHPQVPGRTGVEEPTVNQAPKPGAEAGIFVDGRLNVPNAPAETSTTPAKVSRHNAQLDETPIMARGPQLTDAQRKLIVERVMAAGGPPPAQIEAFPTVQLPAGVEMHPWPDDIAGQVPDIRDTKYVKLSDKVLVVRPATRIVVGEITR